MPTPDRFDLLAERLALRLADLAEAMKHGGQAFEADVEELQRSVIAEFLREHFTETREN